MPVIKPVSDLRNYTEVLADVRPGSPVFLTRNGRGCYAIVDMADYDRTARRAAYERYLFEQAELGRKSGEEHGWIPFDEMCASLGIDPSEVTGDE